MAATSAELRTGVPVFLGYGTLPSGAGQPGYSAPRLLSSWADFDGTLGRPPAPSDPADEPAVPYTEDAPLRDAVRGFFDCGGARCWVVLLAGVGDWEGALASLAGLDDVDLVCAPSLIAELARVDGRARAIEVQAAILRFCAPGEAGARLPARFAILDGAPAAPGEAPTAAVAAQVASLVLAASPSGFPDIDVAKQLLRAGALYFPRVCVVSDPGTAVPRYAPPCGHAAGCYASTDRKSGPFQAPANLPLEGVVDLEHLVGDAQQEGLRGINCLRAFPGRGIRIWGARTLLAALAEPEQLAPADVALLFVNVQRLFLTIGRWLERSTAWAVFEPNDLRLWNRIARQLDGYLQGLFLRGALRGRTPEEAYFVKCDEETNGPAVRASGNLVVQVGLAALVPSEFILIQLTRNQKE